MATDDRSDSKGQTAKKASNRTAKKAPSGSDGSRGPAGSSTRRRRQSTGAVDVARKAAEQLAELTGRQPEGVIGLSRTDEGWQVELEVLEIHRVPETADVLAVYQVGVDDEATLQGYRRLRRYARGQVGEE